MINDVYRIHETILPWYIHVCRVVDLLLYLSHPVCQHRVVWSRLCSSPSFTYPLKQFAFQRFHSSSCQLTTMRVIVQRWRLHHVGTTSLLFLSWRIESYFLINHYSPWWPLTELSCSSRLSRRNLLHIYVTKELPHIYLKFTTNKWEIKMKIKVLKCYRGQETIRTS